MVVRISNLGVGMSDLGVRIWDLLVGGGGCLV